MKNIRRLNKYLKGRYHLFTLSIIMVIIVQALGFLTPLIVKSILDDHLMGIEYPWVEVFAESKYSVRYKNKIYEQTRHLEEGVITGDKISIIIYKASFYFASTEVVDGKRVYNDNILSVTSPDNMTYQYELEKLKASEVLSFYTPMTNSLILYIIVLFICSIIVIIATYTQHISVGRMVSYIARDVRTDAMRSIERLPIAFFEKEPAGKTASRITNDINGFIILYRQIVNVLTSASLSFVLAYIGMFYLDKKLALLSFLAYPFIFLWIRFFLKHLKRIAEKVNEVRSLLTAKINEIINGISILQTFNFKKETVDEYNQLNRSFQKEQMREIKLHITSGWNMIGVIRGLVLIAIVTYFGYQKLYIGTTLITAGLIYAYYQYLQKIIEPINIVFTQVGAFQHAMVQIDRVAKLTEGEQEEYEQYPIKRYKGSVLFDNVWFAYAKKDYVLKGVSFEIKPGEFIGLVGHTGSGKSSLMNLLLRFYDLTDEISGAIYVDGENITKNTKRTYRTDIGIVLQEPTLFKGTIASNIRFGAENVSDEQIEEVLRDIGGEKIIDKFENGIHQAISRAGINMSSGEKQIISIARALIHNPSILVMDEATSHIDTQTEEMVQHAIKVASKNRTVIVIAHRLSTIYEADRIIVLDHGLKIEEGNHQSLILKNGTYASMYYSQSAYRYAQEFTKDKKEI